MEPPICPACKAENDEDAAYCDQCGQHLIEATGSETPAEGGCPACGGVVEDQGGGKGVCADCGLELSEAKSAAPSVKADAGAVERLTAAILEKTGAGLPLEKAVAEGCREVFSAAAAQPHEHGEPQECPLCGAECPDEAKSCGGCGIWFHGFRTPQPCPRCDRLVSSDKCECGAIMTLPKLLEYVEPSVKFVCSRCKAPYAVFQTKCPDCGGGLLSADRLKAFAAAAE
ncbi:MAG: zinc ribbon domain-containing protein [Elusimicrobiota bacterium]